jgi:hypothetical protein
MTSGGLGSAQTAAREALLQGARAWRWNGWLSRGARGGPLHGEASECGIGSAGTRGGRSNVVGAAGGFTEKEWGERGGGSRLSDGEVRRGKKREGGPAQWHVEEGGSGHSTRREVKAAPARERRAHDALGRERERHDAGRWAARGLGSSSREREKRREGDRCVRLHCHWFKLKQTEPNEFERI